MLIDIYGSRVSLRNMLDIESKIEFDINNAFIGTTIESQIQKEVVINEDRVSTIISPYEILELKTDFNKRFKKHHKFTKSKAIMIDFMQEGTKSIQFKAGVVANRPVLTRYGYNIAKGKEFSYDLKISKLNNYVEELNGYLDSYDIVILNQMRSPKFNYDKNGNKVLYESINERVFLNHYAEVFEDLLLSKRENIQVIPPYKTIEGLVKSDLDNNKYKEYLIKHLENICDTID